MMKDGGQEEGKRKTKTARSRWRRRSWRLEWRYRTLKKRAGAGRLQPAARTLLSPPMTPTSTPQPHARSAPQTATEYN